MTALRALLARAWAALSGVGPALWGVVASLAAVVTAALVARRAGRAEGQAEQLAAQEHHAAEQGQQAAAVELAGRGDRARRDRAGATAQRLRRRGDAAGCEGAVGREAAIVVLALVLAGAPVAARAQATCEDAAKYREAATLYRGSLDVCELERSYLQARLTDKDATIEALRKLALARPERVVERTPDWVWPVAAVALAVAFAGGTALGVSLAR